MVDETELGRARGLRSVLNLFLSSSKSLPQSDTPS